MDNIPVLRENVARKRRGKVKRFSGEFCAQRKEGPLELSKGRKKEKCKKGIEKRRRRT